MTVPQLEVPCLVAAWRRPMSRSSPALTRLCHESAGGPGRCPHLANLPRTFHQNIKYKLYSPGGRAVAKMQARSLSPICYGELHEVLRIRLVPQQIQQNLISKTPDCSYSFLLLGVLSGSLQRESYIPSEGAEQTRRTQPHWSPQLALPRTAELSQPLSHALNLHTS